MWKMKREVATSSHAILVRLENGLADSLKKKGVILNGKCE